MFKFKQPHQLWEQEMYTPFSYNQLTKNFHYFASDVRICEIEYFFSNLISYGSNNRIAMLGLILRLTMKPRSFIT